ncbi:MAG: hypothetical protein KIPDCIKN_02409 [Haliscomenobacter sp.]|jgi:outer membrane lipoprotein carrier protein|nr:hypothetical protein [Haliscomenobacter sp.]
MLFLVCAVLLASGLSGQTNKTYNQKADSDPEAKAMLERVRKKYESYPTLEAEFSLAIEVPEQPKEVQRGKIQQKGAKYRIEFSGQTVISDGKSIWIVLSQNKEVQINHLPDAEEDEAILSPQSLFRIYEKGSFAYTIVNEYSATGKILQEIEFKPLDRYSEYSKIRLTVDKKTANFVEIKGFTKDGTRYTLTMTKLTPNKPLTDAVFTFNKANYPGFHIEDLRNQD